MKLLTLLSGLLAALVLAGCGSGGEDGDGGGQPPASATGPGLSIEEALESDLEGPLLVTGYLLADGETVRLCSGFAESSPPQCAEPSLEVIGQKLLEQRQLYKTEGAVTWSDEPVKLLGTVENGRLTVSENAQA